MALITKRIADLLTEVRDILQDQQKTRYTDQELFRYLDQGLRNVALATKYLKQVDMFHVKPDTTFTLTLEAIEFYKITSQQPHEVLDARTVTFPAGEDEDVKIEYYAFPPRIIYGGTVTLELDEDIYDMLRYYIAYRAYEKEASTENLNKAQYFKNEFATLLAMNGQRGHSTFEVTTSRKDYYL